ncbi:MAG TPA: FAD-dependent oxidoreductase [Xanthomonadales bacterium]|nr:FAD-dependent oxidoreductase [Xanthomonadales bacterium]
MSPAPSIPRHIAVIGAGIAGLSCATHLQQAGLKVTLLEKSRGPAGRMSTRRGDDWQCDHGAQYFTARHPAFRAEVARWQRAGVAGLWLPRLQVIDGEATQDHDSSVERFVGIPRMTVPARWLAAALSLRTLITITQLQRHADGWHLLSAEQGWLNDCFDAVILAVPAPQAVPLLPQSATGLAALAGSAVMRASWTLMLRFSAPTDLAFDAAFVNREPLRWIARDSSKPGRTGAETWVLQASAAWSEAHLDSNKENVAPILLDAFAELGGPAPNAWTAHRWRYADTNPALDITCAWERETGVGLCGDWLNGGKIEGAWLSGQALAGQVVESITDAEQRPR